MNVFIKMGISKLTLLGVVLSLCSVAAKKGNHGNNQLLKRLEILEDYQKRSGTRISKLEDDFHVQTSVIEEQNKTIHHLEETVHKLKSTIEHAYRISRRNRRNISLIRGILLKQDFKDGSAVTSVNNDISKTHFLNQHNDKNDNSNHDKHVQKQNHKTNIQEHSQQQNHKTDIHEHSNHQNRKTNTHEHSHQRNHKTNIHNHSHQQNHSTNTNGHSREQNHKTNTHGHSHQQNYKPNSLQNSHHQNLNKNTHQHSHQQNHKENSHQHSHQQNHKANTHQHSHQQNHKSNTSQHSHKQNHKTNTTKSIDKSPRNHNHHNHHKTQHTTILTNAHYKQYDQYLQSQKQNHHMPPHSEHRGHANLHSKSESQNLVTKHQHKQNRNASNVDGHVERYHKHSNKLNGKERSGSSHQYENQQTRHTFSDESSNGRRPLRTQRQAFGGIAFSVYLDHDATVAQHQTVKFNKVITNDGGGYSAQTGVFTCAEGGVYMFTFSIGQRDQGHYMWAELMVNSKNMIDAVVDTYHPAQDLQGGNTVILRLNAGDRVWIDATHNGSHVEGSGTLRLTTFSGLYLYS
ncbi:GATA zinc finger domain-containing protein 14-like [Mercenaria mercenaria]|uniref:GATA zinc finger domain-containing protein 14-like n=1 Tax=Mercenaria mercenaria TaxID=6596 RepID=UPI00234F6CFA|nr:GATA zinc finger domain-containing protein 14-like [Mercenaria mercenaria]